MAPKVHLPVLQSESETEPEAAEPLPEIPYVAEPVGPPPRTRAECLPGGSNAHRPCRWFMCKHNLTRDVGRFRVEDEEFKLATESCVLDVADRHGATLEEVGDIMNLTRERIRQMEQTATRKLNKILRSNPDFRDR